MTLFKAYPYQKQGSEFLANTKRCILGDEMGLGKTCQAILAAKKIGAKNVLIVCPNTLKYVWEDELKNWISNPDSVVVGGTPDERALQIAMGANFTIMNYENLGMRAIKLKKDEKMPSGVSLKTLEARGLIKLDQKHLSLLKSMKYDLIIYDEAHKLKNRNSRIFTTLKELCKKNSIPMYFLTGTPIMNKPEEIWTVLHLIDPLKYSSYWEFVRRTCNTRPAFYNPKVTEIVGLLNPEAFRKELEPYIMRRLKKDVASDLPEKTFIDIPIEMGDKQAKWYKQMKDELFVETKKGIVEAPLALTKLIRLKQIATAPELLEGKNLDSLSGNKIEAMMELIEDSGDEQIIIFSQFAEAIQAVMKMLKARGIKYSGFTGDDIDESKDKAKYRKKLVDEFQTNKSIKCFLTTIQAGGVGITLTEASIVVFLDLMWTPAINAQAVDRVHRHGLKHPVTVYTLTAKNSIEEYIQKVLKNKQALFDQVIPVYDITSAAMRYLSE